MGPEEKKEASKKFFKHHLRYTYGPIAGGVGIFFFVHHFVPLGFRTNMVLLTAAGYLSYEYLKPKRKKLHRKLINDLYWRKRDLYREFKISGDILIFGDHAEAFGRKEWLKKISKRKGEDGEGSGGSDVVEKEGNEQEGN